MNTTKNTTGTETTTRRTRAELAAKIAAIRARVRPLAAELEDLAPAGVLFAVEESAPLEERREWVAGCDGLDAARQALQNLEDEILAGAVAAEPQAEDGLPAALAAFVNDLPGTEDDDGTPRGAMSNGINEAVCRLWEHVSNNIDMAGNVEVIRVLNTFSKEHGLNDPKPRVSKPAAD